MERTTIMLPPALKARAARQARDMGLSMGEFIRHSMQQALTESPQQGKGTLFDLCVYKGPGPSDISARVDDYLYGERK